MSDISLIHICPVPETGDHHMESYLRQVPLGALSLATFLKSRGLQVDFRDYSRTPGLDPLQVSTFMDFLGEPADVIGLSTLSVTLPFAVEIVRELKDRYPRKTIVLGGMGPSTVATGLLETFPAIDCILCGEGEMPLEALLKGASFDTIDGLVFKDARGLIRINGMKRMTDLDALPIPDYSLIDLSSYPERNAHIVTTRGCPYGCVFCCCSHFWGRCLTRRSMDHVMEEIRLLACDLGQKSFRIEDDTFTADKNRVREFCARLTDEHIEGLQWSCMGRIDCIDAECMAILAGAGCRSIYFGIESGSDRVRGMLGGKNFTFREAIETLRLTRDYIPEVVTSFLWGFPFESRDEFLETVKAVLYLEEKEICSTRLSLVIPFAGTPLFERYRNSLRFSEEIINHKMRYYLRNSSKALIQAHPGLFPAFYYIDAPPMSLKFGLFEKIAGAP